MLYEEIKKNFPEIEKLFTQKELAEFKNSVKDDLCLYHFGLGTWLRNNLLQPENNKLYLLFIQNGVTNPDDMSEFIINEFYNYLNL